MCFDLKTAVDIAQIATAFAALWALHTSREALKASESALHLNQFNEKLKRKPIVGISVTRECSDGVNEVYKILATGAGGLAFYSSFSIELTSDTDNYVWKPEPSNWMLTSESIKAEWNSVSLHMPEKNRQHSKIKVKIKLLNIADELFERTYEFKIADGKVSKTPINTPKTIEITE